MTAVPNEMRSVKRETWIREEALALRGFLFS